MQLPEARQEGPEAEKSWKSKRMKYAKIGAAASGAAALMCRNMGSWKLAARSKCLLNHFCCVALSQNSNLGSHKELNS